MEESIPLLGIGEPFMSDWVTTLWDQVQKRLERRFNRGELAKVATAVEQAALPR